MRFILGIVFLACCLLYPPSISLADEQADFSKILEYSKDIGTGLNCIDKKELKHRMKIVEAWIDTIAPHKSKDYKATFIEGVTFYSLVQDSNPNAESCTQILAAWNNVAWPDVEVGEDAAGGNESSNAENSGWLCNKDFAKIDNSASISCSKLSSDSLSSGDFEGHAIITVRCKDNETDVLLGWPHFLGSSEPHIVETKIDNQPIEKKKWVNSSNGKAVFRSSPIKWLKTMKDGKRLIVRLKPYQRGLEELEFDITGINDVIDQVSEICKWKK